MIPEEVENPVDIAILFILVYGSPRAIFKALSRKYEKSKDFRWKIVGIFVEDMLKDKARSMVKRLK